LKLKPACLATLGSLTFLALAAQSADPPRPAADIYRDFCAVCHSGGWQGAPIANDEGEWKTRVSAGMDTLFKNAKQGLNAMPAMGTCMDCSDEELTSAITEMLPPSK
jgi:cytochrome c5